MIICGQFYICLSCDIGGSFCSSCNTRPGRAVNKRLNNFLLHFTSAEDCVCALSMHLQRHLAVYYMGQTDKISNDLSLFTVAPHQTSSFSSVKKHRTYTNPRPLPVYPSPRPCFCLQTLLNFLSSDFFTFCWAVRGISNIYSLW